MTAASSPQGLPLAAAVAADSTDNDELRQTGPTVGTADADGPRRGDLYGYAGKRFDYAARLDGMPVFLGCHERDPHIPLARVRETEATFAALGADVATRIYPGAGHGVVEEEVRFARGLLNR